MHGDNERHERMIFLYYCTVSTDVLTEVSKNMNLANIDNGLGLK